MHNTFDICLISVFHFSFLSVSPVVTYLCIRSTCFNLVLCAFISPVCHLEIYHIILGHLNSVRQLPCLITCLDLFT